jgi:hypothetical protein
MAAGRKGEPTMHSYPTRFQASLQARDQAVEETPIEEMKLLHQKLVAFTSLKGTFKKLVATQDIYHYLGMRPHLLTDALKHTLRRKIPETRLQLHDAIRTSLLRSMHGEDHDTVIEETVALCHAAYELEKTFQLIEPLCTF